MLSSMTKRVSTGLSLPAVGFLQSVVVPAVADQFVGVSTPTPPLPFDVSDHSVPAASLAVSRVSANPTLVPNANITFGGGGSNRTVTVTPAAGQTGTALITLTVDNGSLTRSTSFLLTVAAPPQFTQFTVGSGGSFVLSGTGPDGQSYRILATTNLSLPVSNWPTLKTGSFSGGGFSFTDVQANNHVQRFYQVVTP